MARRPANSIIQRHHITYDPPLVVYVRCTEHWILTTLQRMKVPTKGFLIALKHYIKDNKLKAISGKELKITMSSIKKLKEKIR